MPPQAAAQTYIHPHASTTSGGLALFRCLHPWRRNWWWESKKLQVSVSWNKQRATSVFLIEVLLAGTPESNCSILLVILFIKIVSSCWNNIHYKHTRKKGIRKSPPSCVQFKCWFSRLYVKAQQLLKLWQWGCTRTSGSRNGSLTTGNYSWCLNHNGIMANDTGLADTWPMASPFQMV